jgi:glyceraldehyde 3-phosphate dehydrogenase
MSARVGINGFGRVGRSFLRRALTQDVSVVAINDLVDAATLAYLLRFDSTYGRFEQSVEYREGALVIAGLPITVTSQRDPAALDWEALGVDIVIECTGRFRSRGDAMWHLKSGARKVLLSAPGKRVDRTIVMGINQNQYDPLHHDVVSAASCTTNCVVPMVSVLHEEFGVRKGFLTTVHAYTADQLLLDGPHRDLRRGRAAALNVVPTSTGAARATGQVIGELADRLDGVAVRVPVEDGSLSDLTVVTGRDTTVEEVNTAFRRAAQGWLAGILRYENAPIVSRDIVGDPASCVLDAGLTQVNGDLVKVFGWYDNEYGYACRLVDLCRYVADRL